eukprot:EC851988.1.p1 GENE.EC851988.1~~EC851988.1.p1  ORF type:complete len:130 (+),score=26.71 EC851988.1:52-441(+)
MRVLLLILALLSFCFACAVVAGSTSATTHVNLSSANDYDADNAADSQALREASEKVQATNFPPIWPYPSAFTSGSDIVTLDANHFKFSLTNSHPDLQAACDRIRPLLFPHRLSASATGDISQVKITVKT